MSERMSRGLHVVTSHSTYIRTRNQSWSIGTLYEGQQFDVQGEEKGYCWGYAFGNFKGHGWVNASSLDPKKKHGAGPHAPQKPPRHLDINRYASAYTPPDAPKGRLTIHVRLTRNSYLYGNYRHGRVSDPHGHLVHVLSGGEHNLVGFRYVTRDGRFCMVRHDSLNLWGFMKTSHLTMPMPNIFHGHEPWVILGIPVGFWRWGK
jgi:hypothetical protein